METILISWLSEYTGVDVFKNTEFNDLNFDIFDEAIVVDFVKKNFKVNVNIKDQWFTTVDELLNEIYRRTKTHV